jgi:hypothetical protein
METMEERGLSASGVNYDDTPIVELELEEVEYRVDAGLGAAIAISSRNAGSWQWALVTEARWDGVRLRARGLGHPLVSVLERALAKIMAERAERTFG